MSESALPVLDAAEQRVLGSLLEKQVTVPATYPLTLNALRTACNQSSSRDPVVDFDAKTVEDTARALKARGLIRVVWAERGSRTLKYHQLLDETLSLQPDERALITVLLLRGAQSPGELKTRTERLYGFADRAEVERCLRRMAGLPAPFVTELDLRPGQQDRRWIHLLGPVVHESADGVPAAGVVGESVLEHGSAARDARVVASYDRVASVYADERGESLADKPFERWLLTRVAESVGAGPVADVGCGPGQVAGFLAVAGVQVTGYDASAGMIEQARRLFPGLDFQVADLRSLPRPRTAPGWSAVLGWFATGELAPSELRPAFDSLRRVLAPGGWLVLAIEAGEQVRHLDQWWGVPVDLDVVQHDPRLVVGALRLSGFAEIEWHVHGLIREGGETATLYVVAKAPGQPAG